MGKRIIQQRRGRGTSTYRAHSFRSKGALSYNAYNKEGTTEGEIVEIFHSAYHSAPISRVRYANGREALMPAHEGAFVGKKVVISQEETVEKENVTEGNAYMLKNIPEGTLIYNIELTPGDSGRLVKAGGSFATVVFHDAKGQTRISLPSKKEKTLNSMCRAFVGAIGASGRTEKPFLKAGAKFFQKKKTNKLYPKVSGVAMSAYDHPHGSTRSLRKGRPTISPKNAPPGRKVGMLRPRHTGRNR